jgi:hypothetical protein
MVGNIQLGQEGCMVEQRQTEKSGLDESYRSLTHRHAQVDEASKSHGEVE